MARLNLDRFHRDLDAMGEGHVRQKILCDEFSPVQVRAAEKWLSAKEAQRAALQAERSLAISQRNARWTMIGAMGTLGTVLIAALAFYAAK